MCSPPDRPGVLAEVPAWLGGTWQLPLVTDLGESCTDVSHQPGATVCKPQDEGALCRKDGSIVTIAKVGGAQVAIVAVV